MNYEIKNLPKINMSFLRLLTCNGGHKDVPDNIARAFKDNHDIHAVFAMDGSLSFYPRSSWIKEEWDYSKYEPRLAFDQDSFWGNLPTERIYIGHNAGSGYMVVTKSLRFPTGLYLVK